MLITVEDFNPRVIESTPSLLAGWEVLKDILLNMPLHLKASDQSGIQGQLIFDPVGTNEYIKQKLVSLGWASNVTIPLEFRILGTDVDFIHDALLVEVQFSNYPFLLNNLLRSELFFKGSVTLGGQRVAALVVITKSHMLPASNSTLYFEQARDQLNALSQHSVFSMPIRLVGLEEEKDCTVEAIVSKYAATRYSRQVLERNRRTVRIIPPRSKTGRCRIELI